MLDQKLMERQARESGICPVREELFSQCFDEIIRQICLNEPERGLLLLRIRDEIKMTISAYQTLYQSSATFAMRKQVQAEEGMGILDKRIAEYEKQKKEQTDYIIELKSKLEAIETRCAERREIDQQKRKKEVDLLKAQDSHLNKFIRYISEQNSNK